MAQLINAGDLDALDEVVDADAVDHDPMADQKPGPRGFKEFFGVLRSTFPDLMLEPVSVLADDEHVAMATRSPDARGRVSRHRRDRDANLR